MAVQTRSSQATATPQVPFISRRLRAGNTHGQMNTAVEEPLTPGRLPLRYRGNKPECTAGRLVSCIKASSHLLYLIETAATRSDGYGLIFVFSPVIPVHHLKTVRLREHQAQCWCRGEKLIRLDSSWVPLPNGCTLQRRLYWRLVSNLYNIF